MKDDRRVGTCPLMRATAALSSGATRIPRAESMSTLATVPRRYPRLLVASVDMAPKSPLAILFSLLLLAALPVTSGCRDAAAPEGESTQAVEAPGEWREEYLQYAVGNLQRLEEYGTGEMLQQIVDRLNQWARTQKPPTDWQVDPLVATLPKPLADLPEVQSLGKLDFLRDDGNALQEAMWMRDVSAWARGKQLDDLARAKCMFDWVVRNVQLEPGTATAPGDIPNRPWETLLFGRGTATDRAWVFVLLARQQGIDAVVLALPAKGDAATKELRNWAVGVLEQGKLYLFDPVLGAPIPASGGVKFDKDGQLDIVPATLDQVVKDDALLRQLDVDPAHPYPVTAAEASKAVALVEASPAYLAARMRLFESRLVGQQKAILTANPTAVVKRVKGAAGLADARLWLWPYEVIQKRSSLGPEAVAKVRATMLPYRVGRDTPLWRGRVMHLKGVFSGPQSATYYYQESRLSNRRLAEMRDAITNAVDPTEAAKRERIYQASVRAKADATYWMGLVVSSLGNPKAAMDYFVVRTLNASPDSPWSGGAVYNLGRTLESLGQREKAAEVYTAESKFREHAGYALRARWLKPPATKISLPGAE